MTFLELAEKVLKDNSREMTVDEIWNYIKDKGLDKELGSTGATPWATLSATLGDNVRQRSDSVFGRTDTRPKKYFLVSQQHKLIKTDIEETKPTKVSNSKFEFLEKDLHPFVAYFANFFLKVFAFVGLLTNKPC